MMRQILSVFVLFLGSMVSVSAADPEPASQPAASQPPASQPAEAQPPASQPAVDVAAADDSNNQDVKSESKSHPVSFWMEKKLEYSQEILRGLATGDLQMVEQKAEQMRVVSRIEGWVRNGKPGYRAQFQAFQFANAEILRNARADNLDGAALGFQQLTISCVSCHKMLRDLD